MSFSTLLPFESRDPQADLSFLANELDKLEIDMSGLSGSIVEIAVESSTASSVGLALIRLNFWTAQLEDAKLIQTKLLQASKSMVTLLFRRPSSLPLQAIQPSP